jgi:hypothetical protein
LDVTDFSITILSEPAGHKVIQDEENNVLDFCWFEGMTTKLTITATSILETKKPIILLTFFIRYIIISSHYNTMNYRKITFAALEGQLISQLLDYGTSILKASNFNTIPFLTNLTKQLHDDLRLNTEKKERH